MPEKRRSVYFETDVSRPDIEVFLRDLIACFEKHGFALGIDKGSGQYGEFLVTKCKPEDIQWLLRAKIGASVDFDIDQMAEIEEEELASSSPRLAYAVKPRI